jgi:hypothetical protein
MVGMMLVLKLGTGGSKQATLSPTESAVAAMQNVQISQPAIEAYFASHSSYVGMTAAELQAAGGGAALPAGFSVGWVDATRYCVEDAAAGGTAYLVGPSGSPAVGSCPPAA